MLHRLTNLNRTVSTLQVHFLTTIGTFIYHQYFCVIITGTLINWCLSCSPTSDRRSALRPLDLTTLTWHIFHRKPCEIEAWRSDDKTICFGNESGQYVQDTSVVGTYWLSLKVISPRFIKVQCEISCDSENLLCVLCWSKQKNPKWKKQIAPGRLWGI